MDTNVVATPSVRAWGLLADLAAYIMRSDSSLPANGLSAGVANLLQHGLLCPWGRLVIQGFGEPASANWGRSDATINELIASQPDLADYLEIPLTQADQALGTLILGIDAESRGITAPEYVVALRNQLEMLLRFQQSVGIHQANEQRHSAQLATLQRASAEIGAALNADELLKVLFENVRSLISFKAVEICFYHRQSQSLAIAFSRGVRHRSDHSQTYRLNEGLVGWIARHRRSLRLGDMHSAPVRPNFATLNAGVSIRSYIGVPLQSDQRLLGTIELFSDQPDHFSATDERALTIIAAQVAQMLDGMQRHEQADEHLNTRMQQLKALQRISRELTATLYLHNILGFALDEAIRAAQADSGYIALRGYQATQSAYDLEEEDALGVTPAPQVYIAVRENENDRAIRIIATNGYAHDEVSQLLNQPLASGTTLAELSVDSGEALILDEAGESDRPLAIGPSVAAAIAVPIYYEAQVIGVINLHSQVSFTFDRDALDFVRAVADQIALAIGNEQRWMEQRRQRDLLQQRANTLNEVLRIGQELRADRSLDDVLEQIAFSVVETAGFRAVVFYATDVEQQHMQLVSAAGLPLTEIERLRQAQFSCDLARQLTTEPFQIGRCYYIPGELMRSIAPGLDLIEGDPIDAADGWQADDAVFVPLYSTRGQLIGMLAADEPYDRYRPTRRSVESLEIFADQAAIAIENTGLLREARSQAEQMTALHRASISAAATLSLDDLVQQTYDEIAAYMGIPSFMYIATYDPQHETTRFEIFMREGAVLAQYHHAVVPKRGWTGHVIDTGELLHIRDASDHTSQPTVRPVLLGEMIRSFLGIPLRSQDQIVGVLSVQSFNPHAFSDADVQFLSTLANQLAVALDKVRLFREREQRIEELHIINRIARITSSTVGIEHILYEVYACLAGFLPVDAFYAIVYQSESNEIGYGLFIDEGDVSFNVYHGAPSPGSMTEWILRNREPLRFDDLRVNHTFAHTAFGNEERLSASWLGVPLLIGDGEVIGVLSIQNYTPGLYGEREESFLTTVASQMALGIQNAQLLDQAQAQVRQLGQLNQTSANAAQQLQGKVGELSTLLEAARVLSSSLKPQEVLDSLMDVVRRQLQVSTVALWQNAGDEILLPVAMLGIPDDIARTLRVPVGQGMTGRVAAIGEPLVVRNVEDTGSSLYPSFNRTNNYTSFMGVPVRYRDTVVGVLSVMTVDQRDFSGDEVQLLAGMADQAAVALENARLFEEREQRISELTTLNRISQSISGTLDIQEMLLKLYQGLGDVFDTSESLIALYDEETQIISFPIFMEHGVLQKNVGTSQLNASDAMLSSTVITSRKSLLLNTQVAVNAISREPDEPGDRQISSWLGVPIILGNRVLGVLNVQSYEANTFNENDQRFLETVASQAASALGNARLFTERERRIEELATLNQVGQELSAGTAQTDLLETLYRQMGRLIDTSDSFIALYDERNGEVSFPLAFERGQRYNIAGFKISDRDSLTGHVIRSRSTLQLNGDVDAIAAHQGVTVFKYGTSAASPRSWLGVPMTAADKVVGVIAVQSLDQENVYSGDDVRLLETIAAWGATALENARLISESRQSIRELTVLYEVSIALSSTLDLGDIQTTAASSVLELLSIDVAMLSLVDERGRMLPPTIADIAAVPLKVTTLAKALAPLAKKVDLNHALVVNHLKEQSQRIAKATGLQSLLGVPIILRDEQIGIIWAGNRSERDWQEREISLLSIFANQLSQTMARARLLLIEQERRRVADTLRETAQMFTRLRTPEGIYELVFDQLNRVLQFDTASLIQREGDQLRIIAGRGFEPELQARITEVRYPFDEDPYLLQVFETRRPVVLEDAKAVPDPVPAEGTEHIRGWLGAPLLVDDDVIGILCVDSSSVGTYDTESANIAFALASQAAQALRNARLYVEVTQLNADLELRVEERTAELRDEQDRLRAVHAITLELTATLELQATLNRALELAADAVDAQRGSIMLRPTNSDALICRAVLNNQGMAETTDIRMDFGESGGLVGWVIQTRAAVCIPDVRQDPRWLYEEGRAGDVRSVIAAPLIMQDGPLGVLMLSNPRPDFFRDAQVQLLTTIASEIAIVIHNATLYNIISELAMEAGNAEAQQREENSKNQAILQSLGEGVIVLDEDQQVVLFNPAAEQMLGIPASYVTGQPLHLLIEYPDPQGNINRSNQIYDGLDQGLSALSEQNKNHNRMLALPSPVQSIAMNFAPWVGPRGAIFGSVVVLRDVTREIESDRAKRDFISSVSHELRTPLTSIKGYVDLLLIGAAGPVPESQLSFLAVVKNNANRLMDLINDILEIGRIDSDKIQLNLEPVDIRDVFGDVMQTLRVQIDRKLMDVSVDVTDDVPAVVADQRRITQVVLNLASNAVKYTFPEGRFAMRSFLNPAGMLQIEVEDSGVGISVEDQRNLFRRFQRFDNPLRDEAGGTGLGLSIAKSFVELHGGEMWVTSEPGQGSTFSFIIPVTQPEAVDDDLVPIV